MKKKLTMVVTTMCTVSFSFPDDDACLSALSFEAKLLMIGQQHSVCKTFVKACVARWFSMSAVLLISSLAKKL